MTDEELEKEQRRDFEARRDLAFKQLVCAYFRDGCAVKVNIHGDTIITAIREVLNCKRLKKM